MSVGSGTVPQVLPATAGGSPSAILAPLALDDRWAGWLARERQRDLDLQQELRTAVLVFVIVAALGGAVYLSFGGVR
jgi:hypothetical protein